MRCATSAYPTAKTCTPNHVRRYALERLATPVGFDLLANALTQLLTDYDQYTHEVARWLRDQEPAAD